MSETISPQPLLSIVVPTYNEKDNIPILAERIFTALAGTGIEAELIVVDDNSPDGTAAAAEALKQKYPIKVVKRAGKLGLSSAVIAGWNAASGYLLGVIDADLSHDPAIIPDMVHSIMKGGAEIAVGSRYIPGGGISNWPFIRRLASWTAVMLGRPICPVKDVTSGFMIFRRNVIKGAKLNPIGFKINLEILVKGHYTFVTEVPYTFVDRQKGASKFGKNEIRNYLVHLFHLLWHHLKMRPKRRVIPYTPFPSAK